MLFLSQNFVIKATLHDGDLAAKPAVHVKLVSTLKTTPLTQDTVDFLTVDETNMVCSYVNIQYCQVAEEKRAWYRLSACASVNYVHG